LSKKPIDELAIADLKSLIGGQGWSKAGGAARRIPWRARQRLHGESMMIH
jgi:hypothetical protein